MIKKNSRTEYCRNKNASCVLTVESRYNFKPRLSVQFNGLLSNKQHRQRLMRLAQGIIEALADAEDET